MDHSAVEDVAVRTLQSLEWRLKRLEFLLTGSDAPLNPKTAQPNSEDDAQLPVTQRLKKLEQNLQKLASKSNVVSELIKLRKLRFDSA
jgi:hypothetical protein